MRDVVEEIEQVAAAKRIRIPGENLIESVYRLADAMPTATSSTAQDIARVADAPRSTTSTAISRARARSSAFRRAVNRTLHALVKLLETTA